MDFENDILDDADLEEDFSAGISNQKSSNIVAALETDIFGDSESEDEEEQEQFKDKDADKNDLEDIDDDDVDFDDFTGALDQMIVKSRKEKKRKRKKAAEDDEENEEEESYDENKPEKKKKKKKKSKGEAKKRRRKDSDEEGEEQNISMDRFNEERELERDLKKMGRSARARKPTQSHDLLTQSAVVLLTKMSQAAEADRQAIENNQPAIHKLRVLPDIPAAVNRIDLQEILIEQGLLSAFAEWLQLTKNGDLPVIKIRTEMLHMLTHTIAQPSMEDLKSSEIGKAVMVLVKHPKETPENRRMAHKLVQKWARPIFEKSESFREMVDRIEEVQAATIDKKKHRQKLNQLQLQANDVDEKRWHAKIPKAAEFDYTRRPVVKVQPFQKKVNENHMSIKSHLMQSLKEGMKGAKKGR